MFPFAKRDGRPGPRRPSAARLAPPEALEDRLALSTAAASPVVLESASTVDSKSVVVAYEADPTARAGAPLRFGVYRSADASFDPSDVRLALYEAPASARTPGSHELTIPVEGGLPIDVARPYVLVVADPDGPGASADPARTASFRKFAVGVVTHGGIINKSWTYGSPWQLQIGRLMEEEGYDAVIPYNWIDESHQSGHAAPQGAKLVNQIQKILDQLPDDTVVDLHMVGHSQGSLVNSVALARIEESTPAELRGGWIQATLLDPHAANNYVPGQMSTSTNPVGILAREIVTDYQARAKDPTITIPANVDQAEVLYQHTDVRDVHKIYASGYNLWGQVPVPNLGDATVSYYNLTRTNATHSGATGVQFWYRNFIATTLAEQAPLLTDLRLAGRLMNASPSTWTPTTTTEQQAWENWGPDMVVPGDRPTFSGTAAPDATVRVYFGPTVDLGVLRAMEVTTADADGRWSVTADRDLRDGRYRAVAMAYSPEHHTRPAFAIVSMTPMGRFWIGGDPRA
jgi:hypothetical protein